MTKNLWSYTTGKKRVNRVRVYERRPESPLNIEWWANGRRHQRSLTTVVGLTVMDKNKAVMFANYFAERMVNGHKTAIIDKIMEPHVAAGLRRELVERLTLPEDELFAHEIPVTPMCGVYFLLDNRDNVIYVGKSENILGRVAWHFARSGKAIARCAYQLFDYADLDRAEAFYMHRFSPRGNRRYEPVHRDDKELLASLVGAP